MPIPSGVETVTVSSGEPLTLPDGTLYKGHIRFISPDLAVVPTDDFTFGGEAVAELVDGEFSIVLVPQDATGISPTAWTYTVIGEFSNAPGWTRYVQLTKNSPTVALADVLDATAVDPVSSGIYLPLTGGTMTGDLVLADDPDADLKAATKQYVDAAAALLLALAGGTMTGTIDATLATAATEALASLVTGDTFNRFVRYADGSMEWGPGNGALDVRAARTAADQLTLFDDFVLQGTGKAYRFRRGGSALDLEATGVDLLLSNWSGTAFDGTQRSYARLSADAMNTQWAGKLEFVDALYGATRHVLDGAANTVAFHGATPQTQPTVSGSLNDGTALASLLAALDARGDVVDTSAAGVGRILYADKDALLGRNTTVTPAADPDLTVTLEANATYVVESVAVWANGGGGFRCAWSAPAGASMTWTDNDGVGAVAPGTNVTFASGTGTTFQGRVKTAGTAGALTFLWAQNTSNGADTSLREGSYLLVRRVE